MKGKPKKIRSRLVPFTVTARLGKSDTWFQWDITLQGNRIPEEQREWLEMAHKGGYHSIKLTRKNAAAMRQEATIKSKADIAREGLRILDEILAKRKVG